MGFDTEKMHKLPPAHRFLDVNDLWYFPNRWAVRALYSLPISANQITFLSLILGLASAVLFAHDGDYALIGGAVLLYGKLYLDNVDGNLARVRGEVSRLGRFFDSLTDFVVSVSVYAAITWRMVSVGSDPSQWILGAAALLSSLVHCSYFVFYLVKYTELAGAYSKNRPDEQITEEDRRSLDQGKISRTVIFMQRVHVWVYGWQDKGIELLDLLSRRLARLPGMNEDHNCWYSDKIFLTLSSPLCLCTNTMALVVFALLDRLELCFWLIVLAGNFYMIGLQMWKILRGRYSQSAPNK